MIKNKKFISFIVCFTLIFLAGCHQQNQIGPAELTRAQQDIVDLLTVPSTEILLFDYITAEAYVNMEFWLEVYEYGTLIDRLPGMHQIGPEPQSLDGRLAIIINQENRNGNQDFQWPFIVNGASNRFESSMTETDGLARAFGPITDPVVIQDGKEIVLYISQFSRGSIRTFGDMQTLVEHPELLTEYPYAYIIKARFSR